MAMHVVSVFLPGVWALGIYYTQHGGSALCDKPLGNWLWLYGASTLLLGAVGVSTQSKLLSVAPAFQSAQKATADGREDEAQEILKPHAATIASVAMLNCCVAFPLGVFAFFWYLKGQFDVWGTYAVERLTAEVVGQFILETHRDSGYGCDAPLLNATRLLMVFTYIGPLCTCCLLCCAIGVAAARVERDVGAPQSAQRSLLELK